MGKRRPMMSCGWNWMRGCLAGLLMVLLCTGCSDSDNECVELTRDDRGVWFITGPDDASLYDVYEVMGYAVATDRLWQAEKFRRTARGRLAEIFGEDQLPTDVFMRITGYTEAELQAGFDALNEDTRTLISGYVAGFNRRIAELREDESLVPYEFKALNFMPEDWVETDVLAWSAAMLREFDPEGRPYETKAQIDNGILLLSLIGKFGGTDGMVMFNDLRWENDPDALTYIHADAEARKTASKAAPATLPDPDGLRDLRAASRDLGSLKNQIQTNLERINADVKMGSYAWVLSGARTASGLPTIYSGPQMGFSTPSIIYESSVRAGGLDISGMGIAGLPGIVIGRTPHHAWSMQVGHAHTTDYYIESAEDVYLSRTETILVRDQEDVSIPVYYSSHGPIINPIPYDPATYEPSAANPIMAWKYAHRGYEFQTIEAYLELARAQSMDEFGAAIEKIGVSQHFCYADRDGNIAYWMSGRNPVRPDGEWRLPQGAFPGAPILEWDAAVLGPRSTDRNSPVGYYGGWNNKTNADYPSSYNNLFYTFGPFHRAHVLDEYLAAHDQLTFEEIRDLALYIASTDSFGAGGNPWTFVSDVFAQAVRDNAPTDARQEALALLEAWDGHFVEGGKENWASGTDRPDAWILMHAWLVEAVQLTFLDELGQENFDAQPIGMLFNAMLHGLLPDSAIRNNYDWFTNLEDETAPQTADAVIVAALDTALEMLGDRPWGTDERGETVYTHEMIGEVHTMPFSSRSTFAHCVEMGSEGPVRIESMFPLGPSGNIIMNADGSYTLDPYFFSMTAVFDNFAHRPFPLFD